MSIKVKIGGADKTVKSVPRTGTTRPIVVAAEKKPLITPDSVALGADTTGNYIAELYAGQGIVLTPNTHSETSLITVSHLDTSNVVSTNNASGTILSNIEFDTFGHVTVIETSDFIEQANRLATPRTINLVGDVSGNVVFDGTSNVSIDVVGADFTLGNTSLTIGDSTNEILGLTQFGAGDLNIISDTISSNGDIVLAPVANTGVVSVNDSRIINLLDPVNDQDAATRGWVGNELDQLTINLRIIADPVDPTDATNKRYVDNLIQGLIVRPAALAATTGNFSASYASGNTTYAATLTIAPTVSINVDNVTDWEEGDILLVKAQTNPEENGAYELIQKGNVTTDWIFQRSFHNDQSTEIPGSFHFVTDGDTYRNTGWVATVTDAESFTLGTDDIVWTQFQGEGTFTAGSGLSLNGTQFNVNVDDYSIGIDSNNLYIKQDGVGNLAIANSFLTIGNTQIDLGDTAKEITGLTSLAGNNQVLTIDNTGGLVLPAGTTFDRPLGVVGMIRYNSTDGRYEAYDGTAWTGLGAVSDNDQDTYIQAENTPGSDNDQLKFYTGGSLAALFNANNTSEFYNNVDITGDLDVSGNVTIGGNITIGDQETDSVTVAADFESNLVPNGDNLYDLGSSTKNWRTIYVDTITNNDDRIYLTADIIDANSSGGFVIPVGLSTDRPTAEQGMIRYNTSDNQFEGYNGTAWAGLGGVIDVDQDTKITAETSPGSDNDQLKFFTGGVERFVIDNDGTATFNDRLIIPSGNSSVRMTPSIQGSIRYNTEDNAFEGYDGVNWGTLGGVKDADQDTYIQAETASGSDNDQLDFYTGGNLVMRLDSDGDLKFGANLSQFVVDYNTGLVTIRGNITIGDSNTDSITVASDFESHLIPNADRTYNLGSDSANWNTLYIDTITSSDEVVDFDISGGIILPEGTTAERPTPARGMVRYNTTDSQFEGYDGTAWSGLGGVIDVDQDTYIEAESSSGSDNDELKFYTAGNEAFIISNTGVITTSNSDIEITPTGNVIIDTTLDLSNNEIINSTNVIEIIDGANTANITLLETPKLHLGSGLELGANTDIANNEFEVGIDQTGVTAGMYGTDGFTPRIRITPEGRIDFATEIPVELQANAIPDFTETVHDLVGLMFTDGVTGGYNEGITFYNDDANNLIYAETDNFDITIQGAISGSNTVVHNSNVTINTTLTLDYIESVANGAGIDIQFTQGTAANATISHTDTSSQASLTDTNQYFIQSIELDDFGHITSMTNVDGNTVFLQLNGDNEMTGDLIAPRFLDSANNSYLIDPDQTSRVKDMVFGYGASRTQLEFIGSQGSTYLYSDGRKVGILNSGFNWANYTDVITQDFVVETGRIIAPEFVDYNDGTYKLNPAGTDSRLNSVIIDGEILSDSDLYLNANGAVDVSNSRIARVSTPTGPNDAANKQYVDDVAQGLRVIPSALAATTADLGATYNQGTGTLTLAAANTITIDGVSDWNAGDRLLVKDQTNADENGAYEVTTAGNTTVDWVFTRGEYFNEASEIPGSFQFVTDGTLNAGTGWVVTVTDAETFAIGDDITWYQFSGAGTYIGGDGLDLTGVTFSVNVDDSTIEIDTDSLRVKDAGITNAKLANPNFTIAGEAGSNVAIALGETLEFEAGEGVNTSISAGKVTIASELATDTNIGAAAFSNTNFDVTAGTVTVTDIDGGTF